jgi:hypothetical protein
MHTAQQPRSLYTGPRPSPARRWAPWVIVASAVLAVANVVMLVLNLIERGYQEQRESGVPPVTTHIRETLDSLHSIGVFSSVLAFAFLILAVTWSMKRRTKVRLARYGEEGVEATLRSVQPTLYWTLWCALGASLVLTLLAQSVVHVGMTVHEFVEYRGYLAAANGTRAVMWGSVIALVVCATRLQDRREAADASDVVPNALVESADVSWTEAALDGFGTKTWHKVAIGMVVGLTAMFALLIAVAEMS